MVKRGLVPSRARAQRLIEAGGVIVDGKVVTKSGARHPETASIELSMSDIPWVSRAGLKLEHALDQFGIDVEGKICLDIGSSTGGFTEVLLSRGAKRIYAVDVGVGQLDDKLRGDQRVVSLESTDIRKVGPAELPELPEICTIDVSFISLAHVLPKVSELLTPQGTLVALIKPQFEVGKGNAPRGIVTDETLRDETVDRVRNYAREAGFEVRNVIPSPVEGGEGNKEYLLYGIFPGR